MVAGRSYRKSWRDVTAEGAGLELLKTISL